MLKIRGIELQVEVLQRSSLIVVRGEADDVAVRGEADDESSKKVRKKASKEQGPCRGSLSMPLTLIQWCPRIWHDWLVFSNLAFPS